MEDTIDAEDRGHGDPGGTSNLPPAAWYQDPRDPSLVRYWDGSRWTEWTNPSPRDQGGRAGTPSSHDERAGAPHPSHGHGTGAASPYGGDGAHGLVAAHHPTTGADRPAGPDPAQPIAGLGRAIGVMLLVAAGCSAVAVLSDLAEINLLADIARAPERVSEERVLANDARQGLIALLRYMLYLSTAITFLVWFHRVYTQPSLSRERLRFAPGWAVGAWFVPVLNWFRPKQLMDDVWRASAPPGGQALPGEEPDRVPELLHGWWALWLLSVAISGVEAWQRLNAEFVAQTIAAFQDASRTIVAVDVLDIPLALVAFLVVSQVTRRVEARMTQAPSPSPAGRPSPSAHPGYPGA